MSHALILFAHGSRDPAWAAPFAHLKSALEKRRPRDRVSLAYLELMSPSLEQAVAEAAAAGAEEVSIVPLFLAAGSHVRKDLPRLVDQAAAVHPHLRFRVLSTVGEVPEVLEAMSAWIDGAAFGAPES